MLVRHKACMLLRAAGAGIAVCGLAVLNLGPACAASIEFWCPWPHAAQAVRELAASYSKRTGTQINVKILSPASYSPWTAKSGPDLVGLYRPTKQGIQDLVKSGRVADLQSAMQRGWYADFWPGMLETFNIRKGGRTGVYGVPLTGQVHVFVYNKTAFRKARIDTPPRTWRELMSISERLVKSGVTPYAGGFGSDKPPLACAYEWSYLGLHSLAETYFGRRSYTSADWLSCLSIYTDMRKSGFTDRESACMSGASAIKALVDGRVAMVFTDSSFESIRAAYKPKFRDYGLFDAPVDDRAHFLPRQPGGVVEAVVVNSRGKHKQEAVAFARWLTEVEQQVTLANGSLSIPATPAACDNGRLRPHLRAFAAAGMRDQAVDMRSYEDPNVLAAFYSGVRGILAGSDTPAGVARRAQAARKKR